MQQKYVERRVRANSTVWAVNPPKNVREALEIGYEQYTDREIAAQRSRDIVEAYQSYKIGSKKQDYLKNNSVGGLLTSYKKTNSWTRLKPNSKRTYNQIFDNAMHLRLGQSPMFLKDMLAANVDVSHAEAIFQQVNKDISQHRANNVCKVLRRIWFVGMRLGIVKSNPFTKMGLRTLPSRVVMWEPEQVTQFIKTADSMGIWSMGTLALLCYDLCQRPGDMRQLRWSDYQNGQFSFTQEKTQTVVDIPASPRLLERLANPPRIAVKGTMPFKRYNDPTIIIYEPTGQPLTRFYNRVTARIRNAAGLPFELQMRDLRRTGATEMAEAGCTEDELRSVTGHQSRDVLSIYVRPTKRLAQAGINKRFQNV